MNLKNFAFSVDRLGVIVFVYVILYSVFALKDEQNIWNLILLLCGVAGLSVDSYITYNSTFK